MQQPDLFQRACVRIRFLQKSTRTRSACRRGSIATRDFFELEKRSIFRTSWQLVCHSNDIPKLGRLSLLRSARRIRRHGARQATASCAAFTTSAGIALRACSTDRRATAAHRIACPYHAWTLLARRQADRRAAARHRSAISTWRATAWSRWSRKSSWASSSCASSPACRACARWRRRMPMSSPRTAWKSWCRRAA